LVVAVAVVKEQEIVQMEVTELIHILDHPQLQME
jgi:hypothetical protein